MLPPQHTHPSPRKKKTLKIFLRKKELLASVHLSIHFLLRVSFLLYPSLPQSPPNSFSLWQMWIKENWPKGEVKTPHVSRWLGARRLRVVPPGGFQDPFGSKSVEPWKSTVEKAAFLPSTQHIQSFSPHPQLIWKCWYFLKDFNNMSTHGKSTKKVKFTKFSLPALKLLIIASCLDSLPRMLSF